MMPHTSIGWNLTNSYTDLPDIFYSEATPTIANDPTLVLFNHDLATSLELNPNALQDAKGLQILSGNVLPDGAMPIAQAYAGHQFGQFTNLGDGRAILIGEHHLSNGDQFDIQLKGAGRTNYSRGGDGLAAIGPMLREYIISEAMHGLGVPTSRSLAVIESDDPVYREQVLSRGILTRIAESHLRVGTFEYAAARGDVTDVKALADYAINRHYPYIQKARNPYLSFIKEVIKKQASLIAKWQLVGFIHGVMNTDNMTISGETIDYGPCAFMNSYNSNTVFSSIDMSGRYKYGNQPKIAHWNLTRFAETLLPLIDTNEETAIKLATEALDLFPVHFQAYWLNGMRNKLGLFTSEDGDHKLCTNLLELMEQHKADYTDTFIALTYNESLDHPLFSADAFIKWKEEWQTRIKRENKSKQEVENLMLRSNPAIIPRNHLVESALAAAVNHSDYQEITTLLHALKQPVAHTKQQANLANIPVPNKPYQTFCGT